MSSKTYKMYIYEEKKKIWLEETHLLFHDLAAILDEDEKTLYLWNGPKSTSDRLEKGYESINDLFGSFPNPEFVNSLNIVILEEEFVPDDIKAQLDKMLEAVRKEEELEGFVFTRISSMRLYFSFSLLAIILSLISCLNILFTPFSWELTNGFFAVSSEGYNGWLITSTILLIISLILGILNISVGILEKEAQVASFALLGVIIIIGLLIYYFQGPYLFLFNDLSTPDNYVIPIEAFTLFNLLNIIAYLIFLIPAGYKFTIFAKEYRDYMF